MKWMRTIVIMGVLAGTMLLIAIWMSLPSVEEFQMLAKTRPLYCATIVDRNEVLMGPIYSLPGQSEYTPLDSLPAYVIDDLIFFEDRSFYSWYNFGFNLRGIVRAILKPGSGGGSSLTQQLYRIVTGHKERSVFRKSLELVAAVKLWFGLTKDEVLELYVNNAYFGAGQKLGIAAAANHFFSKRPTDLTRAEGIMLISFLNRPPGNLAVGLEKIYDKYYGRIERLEKADRLPPYDPDYQEIVQGPEFRSGASQAPSFGIFIDRVLGEVRHILNGTNWSLEFDGLIIETTLDREINDALSNTLLSQLRKFRDARGSLIMLNQENEVLAYVVRGKSFQGNLDDLQSNYVMPASRFKILAYAAAIEALTSKGMSTHSDVLNYSLPTSFKIADHFTVHDSGPATLPLRRALSESKNACAYFVSNRISSPEDVVRLARMFGAVQLKPYPSIALGTQGFSEYALSWVYSTILVRNGYLKEPTFVRRILTRNREVIYDASRTLGLRKESQIVSAKTCKILRQALRESVEEGTSRYLSTVIALRAHDIVAKTGTSENNLHLGFTGAVDQRLTFSLLMQSKHFSESASKVAVPIMGLLLERLKLLGKL